jgi:hypothetical protein
MHRPPGRRHANGAPGMARRCINPGVFDQQALPTPVPEVVVPTWAPPTVVPQGMPLASFRVEVEEFNWPEPLVDEFNWPVPVVGEVTWPPLEEFNWLPWVLRMPELVGDRVEPAADVPALPGMVLLLEALLPVAPLVVLAPPVAAAAPLDPPAAPPAEAPPPAPAASAMLLPPRMATVASKAT